MDSLAQNGSSHEQVKNILLDNRVVTFEFDLLDKNEHSIGTVTASGSIDCDTSAQIVRGARFTIKESKDINYIDERLRPKMKVRHGDKWFVFPLGVYLLSSPSIQGRIGAYTKDTEAYDKSAILAEDKFTERTLFQAGTGYVDNVISILNSAGITNVNITPNTSELSTELEFEIGTSKLEAINKLLKSINYNYLYFDNNGTARSSPYILPLLRNVDETYQTDEKSIILPGSEKSQDLFNCPNVFVRYLENPDAGGTLISKVVNDNPSDKLSTVSRGRNIVDIESVSDIADQATLDQYVLRVMAEKQVYETISFETALMPHHGYMDCLGINIDSLNFRAKCIETSWSMELKVGGKMRHTCRKVV